MALLVRVRRHLDSETIHIPELKDLVGKDVDIVVKEAAVPAREPGPLEGSILWYDDPYGPAVDPDDWEANR
ncbi:MAG: hypothetical protein ACRDHF_02410 [Tepidiformaceae bacterium]